MIAPTFGLTHITPAVADLDRSLAFYRALFGVEVLVRDERQIQVSTPGSKGVIAFECDPQAAGRTAVGERFNLLPSSSNVIWLFA
jgi:catechol 2,3-dioxygenase-like lactoylglutathione lyase family enzyme